MKLQLPDLAFESDEPIRPTGHRVPEHTTYYQDHLTAFTDDAHGSNLAGWVRLSNARSRSVGIVSGFEGGPISFPAKSSAAEAKQLWSTVLLVAVAAKVTVLSRFAVSFSHVASHVVGMLNVPPTSFGTHGEASSSIGLTTREPGRNAASATPHAHRQKRLGMRARMLWTHWFLAAVSTTSLY
ncbi:hypothetical protein VE02_07723 [Pseudogymnoascus sp. 03VT05]|nr:hypothetical protein VE02_07723 [Pseudogymnoascus sp. 03VT05]